MKTRTIILGIITLIVGFILGMLTSAQIRLHRLRPVRMYFSEERFREGFYKTIQPDEAQKIKIDQILDKYAEMNSEIQGNFRKELDANMKAMRKELDSNLTKEQLARLKEMDERRQEMIKQERRRRDSDTTNLRNEGRRQYPDDRPDRRPPRPGSEGVHHPPPYPGSDTIPLPDSE
jgi:hypothetical protein